MAADRNIYGSGFILKASDYARITENADGRKEIQVKGSCYADWNANTFDPEAARRLATYILELADDADADVRTLAGELRLEFPVTLGNIAEDVARVILSKGYHK